MPPLGTAGYELDERRFAMLCDSILSVPLSRDRPLWEFRFAAQMTEGRCGLVAKMHHALVDGRSALEVAQLLFDAEPQTAISPLPARFEARPAPGAGRLGARALVMGAEESLRAARGAARMAGEPRATAGRLAGTLRRAALATGEDLLRPAPSSLRGRRQGGAGRKAGPSDLRSPCPGSLRGTRRGDLCALYRWFRGCCPDRQQGGVRRACA